MAILQWNEIDFIECLEVLPVVDEYKTQYMFDVSRAGLDLRLTVRPVERIAHIALTAAGAEAPVIDLCFIVLGRVQYLKEKRVEQLEFANALVGPGLHWFVERSVYDVPTHPLGSTIALSIKPVIRIQFLEDRGV